MPEMRTYIVTQTRQVEVTANQLIDATRIAAIAFKNGQNTSGGLPNELRIEGMWGDTTKRIKELSLETVRKS